MIVVAESLPFSDREHYQGVVQVLSVVLSVAAAMMMKRVKGAPLCIYGGLAVLSAWVVGEFMPDTNGLSLPEIHTYLNDRYQHGWTILGENQAPPRPRRPGPRPNADNAGNLPAQPEEGQQNAPPGDEQPPQEDIELGELDPVGRGGNQEEPRGSRTGPRITNT